MKQMALTVTAWLTVALIAPAVADDLTVSGIMKGRHPTAIVNDQVVASGASIAGYRVVEVTDDAVVFENQSGGRITRRLKEEETKAAAHPRAAALKPSAGAPATAPTSTPAPPAQPASKISDKAGRHLDKSENALRQADALLKSNTLKFDELYVRAMALCEEAQLEANSALKNIGDQATRQALEAHIAKIRAARNQIMRDKDDLNTRVRTAIANRRIFAGMTTQNVISSWGVPLSKTTVGPIERWVYKDDNGYQRNLNFSRGVLVSF